MSHCDEDSLSLLALGEPASPGDQRHLAGCTDCSAELAALRAVVQSARAELGGVLVHEADGDDATEGTPVTPIPPPSRVWDNIAAATGVTTRPRLEVVMASSQPAGAPPLAHPLASRNGAGPLTASSPAPEAASAGSVPGDPAEAGAPPAEPSPEQPRVVAPAPGSGPDAPRPAPRASAPRLPRQRRESGTLIGLAAVALIVGLLGGFGLANYLREQAPSTVASPSVITGTTLAGLPLNPAAAGDATVVQTATGRKLDVDVRRLEATSGFYEVWLIDPTVTRMVSVGVLQGAKGEFAVPDGLDLAAFPIVDVSIQGYDSTGGHSGKSVLRGKLRA
jgi:Anti-sigma-K factor rskA